MGHQIRERVNCRDIIDTCVDTIGDTVASPLQVNA